MRSDKRNILARFFIPQYDELALFLMSVASGLIFFTDADLRSRSIELIFEEVRPRIYIALVFFVLGGLFSIYHVFTTRRKTDREKTAMVFFAIIVNGLSGVFAGIHMLEESCGFLMVFPIWNIANGALLLILYRFKMIDKSSIVDDNATILQVILGSIVLAITFMVCSFVFEMYWAVTFSICVAYASNVSGVVGSLFSSYARAYRERGG
ncbi:MAG: hypothetical protein GY801_12670 [bacterium]|nr:hypothetical protein [bacterium]